MKNIAHVYRYMKLGMVFCLLLFSMLSFRLVPFWSHIGLDFQNLYAFHNSASPNNPYAIDGKTAGDVGGRDMIYPPPLYFLFFWTRWVSFDFGSVFWSALVVVLCIISMFLWIERKTEESKTEKVISILFILCLVFQFPLFFAAERGNNDVLVLLFWSFAYYSFRKGKFLLSGMLAGFAAAMKVYPVFSCVVFAVGAVYSIFKTGNTDKKYLVSIIGGLLSVFAVTVVFWNLNRTFFFSILPKAGAVRSGLKYFSHSIVLGSQDKWGQIVVFGSLFVRVVLLLSWCFASMRLIRKDPSLVFAGSLAISTYFTGLSYDYNLVTTLPLLLLLFFRSFHEDTAASNTSYLLLMVGLLAIIAHRGLFSSSWIMMFFHILLQYLWLFIVAIFGGFTRRGKAEKASKG